MSFVNRTTDYERTLVAVIERFPERFGPAVRRLEDGLREPLSEVTRKPFVNPCPTKPRPYRRRQPTAVERAALFSGLVDRIRGGWGLPPLAGVDHG